MSSGSVAYLRPAERGRDSSSPESVREEFRGRPGALAEREPRACVEGFRAGRIPPEQGANNTRTRAYAGSGLLASGDGD